MKDVLADLIDAIVIVLELSLTGGMSTSARRPYSSSFLIRRTGFPAKVTVIVSTVSKNVIEETRNLARSALFDNGPLQSSLSLSSTEVHVSHLSVSLCVISPNSIACT